MDAGVFGELGAELGAGAGRAGWDRALGPAFFVLAKDQRVLRRTDIEPDNRVQPLGRVSEIKLKH